MGSVTCDRSGNALSELINGLRNCEELELKEKPPLRFYDSVAGLSRASAPIRAGDCAALKLPGERAGSLAMRDSWALPHNAIGAPVAL